jgi:hypothetical protein
MYYVVLPQAYALELGMPGLFFPSACLLACLLACLEPCYPSDAPASAQFTRGGRSPNLRTRPLRGGTCCLALFFFPLSRALLHHQYRRYPRLPTEPRSRLPCNARSAAAKVYPLIPHPFSLPHVLYIRPSVDTRTHKTHPSHHPSFGPLAVLLNLPTPCIANFSCFFARASHPYTP